ncbi:hypothetical protein GM168_12635 [Clostridium perfringens]|uniref:hypothetical protein n=1 Tax=Clostridium perfringens TaxID=1502 RepID=UPI001CB66A88|nr:hypothetical protein [Clostridium perfringens]EGT2192655.1 hypothetical protein [Clostridium perfringens]EHK2365058.1 hypothetical protein [Clostridium perfringens]ELP5182808.1 hypothetical protein [Clostridium perfringens]ELP5185360.1 hypothetical protein [Clostridium perfringens]ELP5188108.1 hypothetical protein [Clostridium perfringens]
MGKLGKRIDEMMIVNKNECSNEVFNEVLIESVGIVQDYLESKGGTREVLNEQNRERNLR